MCARACGGRFEEVAEGLRRLTRAGGYTNEMTLTPEEFEGLASKAGGGSLLDVKGGLDAACFETVIRHHLGLYVQRKVNVCIAGAPYPAHTRSGLRLVPRGR